MATWFSKSVQFSASESNRRTYVYDLMQGFHTTVAALPLLPPYQDHLLGGSNCQFGKIQGLRLTYQLSADQTLSAYQLDISNHEIPELQAAQVALQQPDGTGLVLWRDENYLYAHARNPDTFSVAGNPPKEITTASGASEIALAQHLTAIGAKKYGAWWCPHCHTQQTLFGKEAFEYITYVECDEAGVDPQPQACRAAGVQSYPTWEINGETYAGVQLLQSLAAASGYTGPQNFINPLPKHP